jgi:hypothetical protein
MISNPSFVGHFLSIADCRGLVKLSSPSCSTPEEFHLTLEDILVFATGVSAIPPIGFIPHPSIVFHEAKNSLSPMANTCTNTLKLPLKICNTSYEVFKYNFVYGIANTAGFGQV